MDLQDHLTPSTGKRAAKRLRCVRWLGALAGCEKMPVGLMNKQNPEDEDPELREAGIDADAARFVERKRTRGGTSARTKWQFR
jgi:hypothetical protein